LDSKGFSVRKGVIQDATFIESDQGRKRVQIEKKLAKEGKAVEYTSKQLSHIDKDATYSRKAGQVHYGYKNHIKMDVKNQLIREYEVTTASTHDSQVNLINKNDKKAYMDKGYQGMTLPKKVKNLIMKRASRGHPLTNREEERNKKISKIRSPVERPFSVMKRTMHNTINKVTTLARVNIKELFKNIAYNMYQLVTLLA
jgi:IS5 family transposase